MYKHISGAINKKYIYIYKITYLAKLTFKK